MLTYCDLCGSDFRKNGLDQNETFLLGLNFSFLYVYEGIRQIHLLIVNVFLPVV